MKCDSLEEVRENIDNIDDKIIKLIAQRSDYVKQAAYFKKSKTDVKAADRVEKIIDLFDNYTNLEFNKINILKQGVLTPCIDKKT